MSDRLWSGCVCSTEAADGLDASATTDPRDAGGGGLDAGLQDASVGALRDAVADSASDEHADAASGGDGGRPDNCKPGYYAGTLSGSYSSGAFDIGFGSLVEAAVFAGDSGSPGLKLYLAPSGSLGAAMLGVENGCVFGTLQANGTQSAFSGTVTGTLNCTTGEFVGTLDGHYDLFQTNVLYYFDGPLTAQLDPTKAKLTNGKWHVTEKQAASAPNAPGGSGAWSASWVSAEDPGLATECAKARLSDAGTL